MKTKRYNKIRKNLTKSEIAESILISEQQSNSKKEHDEFLSKRLDLLNNRTKEEIVISNIMQFKYEVELYIELSNYKSNYSFASCLKRYMSILNKSSKDITEELTIHKTRLSRILNEREEANPALTYKLEKHSGELLPAIFWWKLIALKKNHDIITNKTDRKEAAQKVKSIIKRRKKVYG